MFKRTTKYSNRSTGGNYGVSLFTLIFGLGVLALILTALYIYVLTSLNPGPETLEIWSPALGSRVWET
jgi:uncharacterized membrane protein